MTEVKLTKCQEQSKLDIEKFLLDESEEVMILSAPAGCGKSFLLEHVLGENADIKDYAKILDVTLTVGTAVTAMSNKAARVVKGVTFDSLLGLFPKTDYNSGKSYRQKAGGIGNPQHNMVIVIDESSMLDSDGLRLLGEMTNKCKIIFVCDRYQLPPVGEKESPIFRAEILTTEMVTPVRQAADSDLYALCQSLREGVRTKTLMPLPESDQVKYITDEEAAEFFTNMTAEDKVLAYTNQTTVNLNQFVREYKGITGFWHEGEHLISNGVLKRGSNTILTNEQEVTVMAEPEDVLTQHPKYDFETRMISTSAGIFKVPADPTAYNAVLKKLAKDKNWREFYPLKESMPDFRGAWSSTIHKSQGSTYRDVFIHLGDLRKASFQDRDLFLRLLYVAVSRAKRQVYLYGRL